LSIEIYLAWLNESSAKFKRALLQAAFTPPLEHILDAKEMGLTPRLLPDIVVVDHVRSLAGKHPDVLWMVVSCIAIDVMDNLSWKERTTQLPLGHRPVLIVGQACAGIRTLLVTGTRSRSSFHLQLVNPR
jgi:hypothetical protein